MTIQTQALPPPEKDRTEGSLTYPPPPADPDEPPPLRGVGINPTHREAGTLSAPPAEKAAASPPLRVESTTNQRARRPRASSSVEMPLRSLAGELESGAQSNPLEDQLRSLLPSTEAAPQALHRAMWHAVFPGGKRVRPRLLLTVAEACAADAAELDLAMHAACAVELIHSASLVHDDLPCFDDASLRRGHPTVHKAYGEAMAVLAGDALLTRAFEILAEAPPRLARRALRIVRLLAQATGSQEGIIGGQSLEQSPAKTGPKAPSLPMAPELLGRYHAMKTAALFRLAAAAGATAAGATDADAWGEVGQNLGLAFQLADDLCDAFGSADVAGKPVRRDAALGRPNAAALVGEGSSRARMNELLSRALEQTRALAVDPTPLIRLIEDLSGHFLKTTK